MLSFSSGLITLNDMSHGTFVTMSLGFNACFEHAPNSSSSSLVFDIGVKVSSKYVMDGDASAKTK